MFQYRNRSQRKLALFATASFLSLVAATPAWADCDPTPVTEPIGNITANGTTVSCTAANSGKTIVSNADSVEVHVQPGATLDNSSVTLNGYLNSLNFAGGSSSNNLSFVTTGLGGQIIFANGSSATNLSATVTGDSGYIRILAGATVTAAPGNIVLSNAPGQYSTFSLLGTLSATGNNGGAYLLTGGSSSQTFNIHGTLNAAPNGLLINAGDGDDDISLIAGAVIGGGTGNNLLFDGGNGNDRLFIAGGGTSNYSSINIEQLYVTPGAGNTRILNGSGDYSQVQLGAGTTSVSSLSALGQSNSFIQLGFNSRLLLDLTGPASFGHSITGPGTIQQDGQAVTYTGNGTGFTGSFLLSSGTATIASNNAFGTGTITTNGSLELTGVTVGNNIGGSGTVTKVGPGTGVLSGNNSYAGGTFVQGGILSITNTNAVSSSTVTVGPGATFDLNFATDQTFSNDITGQGGVSKSGAGIATLTGNNNYSGGTVINAGGIRVDDLARLGTGPVVVANSNSFLILNYNGAAPLVLATPFLSGNGGFIKEGTGELELGGINSWAGGTAVRAGTLRLASGDAAGTGQIRVDAGATLALGNNFSSPSVSNNISGAGTILIDTPGGAALYGDNSGFTGTINLASANAYLYAQTGQSLGAGTVNLGGGGTLLEFDNPNNEIVVATLTGSGTFEKRGNGVLDLTGTNSLTGNVDVRSGTLRVASGANIGTATVNLDSGAFLDVNTSGSTTLGNTITGQGRLQKSGIGTLLVTGTNSYSGGTDIFAGAIRVTDVSALGTGPISVYNGAFLDLSIAGSATLAVNASGSGKLRKSNVGDLTLTGTSLTGGIDITGGRVIVNSVAALGGGPVSTAADTQLVFDISTTQTSSVAISGAGAVTKNGSGTLVMQNANSFTGGTVINAGRLGLNDGGALGSGTVLVQLGAILGIGDITLANNVTGGGQIIKTAGGNAVLTGVNSHSGGIDIQAGSVSVTGNAPLGSGTVTIGSGAQLNYTATSNLTFANALSGAGSFNKLGTGMLTFSNPFSVGSLSVATGRVRINTVATTNATVASGATLDGTGRIVGTLTNNGTVAPGNSIGTLTVQGNYVHGSGSVLEIEFDGAGGIDKLDVTGTATLNGGTLRFVSIGAAEGSGGTFLTAAGGVTGTFATVETVGAQLPLAVIYLTNSAIMAPSVLTARPSTVNAQSFAAADTAFGFVDTVADAPRSGQGTRLWLQGFGADGNRSASGTTLSYGHRSHGLSGGLIVPAGNGWSFGVSGGWAKGDIELGANGGGGDQDSLLGSVQLGYSGNGASFSAGVVAGKVEQDTLRNVSFNGFSASVSGETSSSLIGGWVSGDVRLGSAGGWDFGVSGRGSIVRQSQDGYTESGTSPLRLTVGDIETTTLEGRAGLSAKRSFAGGVDLRFDAGARYLGATGDRAIPVTFAASNAGIVLHGDTRDGVQGYAAARLDYRVSERVTIGAGYSGQVGQTDRHEGRVGVSIGF
ncbi:autotransporter-associated beta strand repeat-containing protein [Sphingomonas sp. AOB5]|uniref:beta strand repeat-containing protein n=1 Tax=Sphingomonas sp. AOB5 TaxID=3034017 RepID=UPI0023F68196|nr:autotransporter-associated beta strand repeat-containing protein [Sphingomonas sp. AOB5]MDF7775414.1 autotransporter-associated beta strand repeat-containing protein [Sphingomonas sp. AOB5]